jgi:hypothetical protein
VSTFALKNLVKTGIVSDDEPLEHEKPQSTAPMKNISEKDENSPPVVPLRALCS